MKSFRAPLKAPLRTLTRKNQGTDQGKQWKSRVQISRYEMICTLYFLWSSWSIAWFCYRILWNRSKRLSKHLWEPFFSKTQVLRTSFENQVLLNDLEAPTLTGSTSSAKPKRVEQALRTWSCSMIWKHHALKNPTSMIRATRCESIHLHTHTHTYIYIYIYVCIYVDSWMYTQ